MITKKIIVVDDDESLLSLVKDVLEREKFMAITCDNTEDGYARIVKSKPDLVILDIKVPRIGGVELCRQLRKNPQTSSIPIIMLTVESTEADKIIGLEMGADDYVTKPFSSKELVARILSLLRRSGRKEETDTITIDGLEMNLIARTVSVNKKEMTLRPKEFDLLHILLLKPNVVLSREFILENVFETKELITTRTIDTHLKNLRHALGKWASRIETVFGRGFKFVPAKKSK